MGGGEPPGALVAAIVVGALVESVAVVGGAAELVGGAARVNVLVTEGVSEGVHVGMGGEVPTMRVGRGCVGAAVGPSGLLVPAGIPILPPITD